MIIDIFSWKGQETYYEVTHKYVHHNTSWNAETLIINFSLRKFHASQVFVLYSFIISSVKVFQIFKNQHRVVIESALQFFKLCRCKVWCTSL